MVWIVCGVTSSSSSPSVDVTGGPSTTIRIMEPDLPCKHKQPLRSIPVNHIVMEIACAVTLEMERIFPKGIASGMARSLPCSFASR